MSYAPPAVPPYPTNFYDQRQYRQNSKPPVPPLPPDFHPDQSVVSPMPERIMPNLPADPHHPHRAPSVYSSLKQNGTYPPDLYRGAAPPQRQHQPDHLAPGEFARSQSAFGSHPGPPPPPRVRSPTRPMNNMSLGGALRPGSTASHYPFRSAPLEPYAITYFHITPLNVAQLAELIAPIPTKDTLLAAQKTLSLTCAGITNHLLEILVMMVECMDNTNSTLL
ncbi:hypothetical protein M422DRAFT_257433 [Sphaerobolus stellatus SS14]|uniref:Uncharacterized protein n=1 Tax=Sphaerobolus stellatus (strain SS14) TaxID=990650 RepID=A0A0C9VEL6_SPHS4|nr:hypothetical protein M422DRAFT_257433 [Sphaerobolus stellatus SS14]